MANRDNLPPSRHIPQLRILEAVGKKRRRFGIHADGRAPISLGVDGVEVHEPGFEDSPCHLLQGLIHAPVKLDLVVEASRCGAMARCSLSSIGGHHNSAS